MTVNHLNAIGDAVLSAAGEAEAGPQWFRPEAVTWTELLRDIEALVQQSVSSGDHVSVPRSTEEWTDFICGATDDGYLCGLPPKHTCAHVAFYGRAKVAHCWLGDAP